MMELLKTLEMVLKKLKLRGRKWNIYIKLTYILLQKNNNKNHCLWYPYTLPWNKYTTQVLKKIERDKIPFVIDYPLDTKWDQTKILDHDSCEGKWLCLKYLCFFGWLLKVNNSKNKYSEKKKWIICNNLQLLIWQ